MHLKVVQHTQPNPINTQNFLLSLNGVVEADVWQSGDNLLAKVIVQDWSQISDTDLRMACKKSLGQEQTPTLIMIEKTLGEHQRRVA